MKLIEEGISIIVPVFNGALFIDDAYKNILNQHLDNFEIIFIDNNSTDASVQKIINLQQKDKRVSYFKQTYSMLIKFMNSFPKITYISIELNELNTFEDFEIIIKGFGLEFNYQREYIDKLMDRPINLKQHFK